jgi:hypothetical protein
MMLDAEAHNGPSCLLLMVCISHYILFGSFIVVNIMLAAWVFGEWGEG